MASSVTSDGSAVPATREHPSAPGTADPPPTSDTRVCIPYVGRMLRTPTLRAVRASGLPYQLFQIDRGTKEDYARFFASWWDNGGTFIVIEQDIVCPPGWLRALAACPFPWCYHPYDVGHGPTGPMLGCAKFAGSLTRAHPRAATVALKRPGRSQQWYPWQGLDVKLESQLKGLGVEPHEHLPWVLHLHDYGNTRVDVGGAGV